MYSSEHTWACTPVHRRPAEPFSPLWVAAGSPGWSRYLCSKIWEFLFRICRYTGKEKTTFKGIFTIKMGTTLLWSYIFMDYNVLRCLLSYMTVLYPTWEQSYYSKKVTWPQLFCLRLRLQWNLEKNIFCLKRNTKLQKNIYWERNFRMALL